MNKNVLIAGASRGLGYSLTYQYLKSGFTVFAGARNIKCEKLGILKTQFKDRLIVIQMDVASSQSVKKAAEQVKSYCNKLDVVINNAGIHCEDSFEILENVDLDNAIKVYNVNSIGILRVTKEFLGLLQNGDDKVLLNISSESGSIGSCKRSKEFDYCMSKAAVNMASVLLQNYLKERKIKVLAVQPGWMRTDMGGDTADIDPLEAAECIFKLVEENKHNLDAPVFVDRYGEILPW